MSMKPKQYYTKKCWLLNIQAFEVKKKKEMQSYHCYSSHGDGTSTKIHKHLLSYHFMIFSKLFLSSIWFDICYPIFPENIPKVSILCSTFFSSYKAFLAGKRNTKIYVVWWPDDNWLSEYTHIILKRSCMHRNNNILNLWSKFWVHCFVGILKTVSDFFTII